MSPTRPLVLGLVALWLTSGCTRLLGSGEDPPRVTAYEGEGWAARLPPDARVQAEADRLAVDAPDGTWWFDVQWVETPLVPTIAAMTWGDRACRPIRWDLPAEPVEGVWTSGGTCTIENARYWAMLALEEHGDRTLLTGYLAGYGDVTYEQVWVDFVGSALSVTAGDTPRPALPDEVVRERVRNTRLERPDGVLPVPGGGTFSKLVSQGFAADVWAPRRDHPLPATFDGSEAPEAVPAPDGEAAGARGDDDDDEAAATPPPDGAGADGAADPAPSEEASGDGAPDGAPPAAPGPEGASPEPGAEGG